MGTLLKRLKKDLPEDKHSLLDILKEDDLYEKEDSIIINRGGILALQSEMDVKVKQEILSLEYNPVKGESVFFRSDWTVQHDTGSTYSSATPDNCSSSFRIETAQKRGLSRAVLDALGLSRYGCRGEGEDFEGSKKENSPVSANDEALGKLFPKKG